MQKSLVTLVLAAAAGIPTWLWVSASPFAVSPAFPLGQLEAVEAWLLDHGFARKALDRSEAERRGLEGAAFYAFAEVGSSLVDEERQVVALGVSSGGAIRSVRTIFYSGKKDLGIPDSRTEEFAEILWSDIAGGDPVFQERHRGTGIHFVEGFGATMSSGSVSGDWYKRYLEVNRDRSILDTVSFTIR